MSALSEGEARPATPELCYDYMAHEAAHSSTYAHSGCFYLFHFIVLEVFLKCSLLAAGIICHGRQGDGRVGGGQAG